MKMRKKRKLLQSNLYEAKSYYWCIDRTIRAMQNISRKVAEVLKNAHTCCYNCTGDCNQGRDCPTRRTT